jgi:hypothetical protein
MARPRKHDGVIYKRKDSKIWWMRYRDKNDRRRLESTRTEDWHEAQRRQTERHQASDDNTLEDVRNFDQLSFKDSSDHFLYNYSKPTMLASKTHVENH